MRSGLAITVVLLLLAGCAGEESPSRATSLLTALRSRPEFDLVAIGGTVDKVELDDGCDDPSGPFPQLTFVYLTEDSTTLNEALAERLGSAGWSPNPEAELLMETELSGATAIVRSTPVYRDTLTVEVVLDGYSLCE